ncbi:hypothetical protein [Providencia vermicola]|uniref:hypothetical protein n=1 Tax=Providencia vermicola TaxID=333965 RepID=UPI003D2D45F2
MNERLLELLFKIPDPITADEFCRRTGKSASSVRKLIDRRRLPIRTERQIHGDDFSDMRLVIMYNEYLEMCWEVARKLPAAERMGWKDTWFKRAKKLIADLSEVPDELKSVEDALKG